MLLAVVAQTAATPHVVVDQVTKDLGIKDSGWSVFAAIAAAMAAGGTPVSGIRYERAR